LLGRPSNGRWLIAPASHDAVRVTRRYRGDTMVLETDFHTATGRVRIIDFMPPPTGAAEIDVIRIVIGLEGTVDMQLQAAFRFDYGRIVPWVRRLEAGRGHALSAVGGPDGLVLTAPVPLQGEDFRTIARFTVSAEDSLPFVLTWFPSHLPVPPPRDAEALLETTTRTWQGWADQCGYDGPHRPAVIRSLLTLKALTYTPTGGIVAASTTSLPERLGGIRNWDYRFCWVRDATFTLNALLASGYTGEAAAWREWLLRSAAGEPSELQVLYGIAGERRVAEVELPWLDGFAGSRPVRIGNAAHGQFQLDIYGELMAAFHTARCHGIPESGDAWRVNHVLLGFLEHAWQRPDQGIWEIRGAPRHFTHSKVMAWAGFDRAVQAVERFGLDGPVEHWRALRDRIHADVCRNGFDADRGSFVQSYGSRDLDAALLLMPRVGFLPATDPRIQGTIAAIERELTKDGLVLRYSEADDGLPSGEGTFIVCSFWYADALILSGRRRDAEAVFERLLDLRNDVGLLAEEYDPAGRRQLGNFPQAFSHVGLINTAHRLAREDDGVRSRN
jgi:GH15 family glucan-1,4-alpha-glucosidase